MKLNKIIYYTSTILLTFLMLFIVGMYTFQHASIHVLFESLGYPTHIIYPLAILKLLGLLAIWNPNFKTIKEWAYAGFFFNFLLAFFAHYMIGDGSQWSALFALLLLVVSYMYNRKRK